MFAERLQSVISSSAVRKALRFTLLVALFLAAVPAFLPGMAHAANHPLIQGDVQLILLITDDADGYTDEITFSFTGLKFEFEYSDGTNDHYRTSAGAFSVKGKANHLIGKGDCAPGGTKGKYSGKGALDGNDGFLTLLVPSDKPIGKKAEIYFELPVDSINTSWIAYDCDGKVEGNWTWPIGYKWVGSSPLQATIRTLNPSPCFGITARDLHSAGTVSPISSYEAWLTTKLYTRFVKAPPVVKPASTRIKPVISPDEALAPLTVESADPDPNGIDGTIILAPLVKSRLFEEMKADASVPYGKANFSIPRNKKSGQMTIKLTPRARTILDQSKTIKCNAVIKAQDQLGNVKTTQTPVAIIP